MTRMRSPAGRAARRAPDGRRRSAAAVEPEEGLDVLPEDLLLLLRAQRLEILQPGDGGGMPRHERPVAAEHDPIGAHLVQQEPQRLLAADYGVVVEPPLIGARRPRDRAALGRRAVPAAVDAAHRQT